MPSKMLHLQIAFTPSEKGGDWVLTPNPNIRGPPSTEYIENYWRVSEVYPGGSNCLKRT